jgi:predicted nucleotidyltransferase
MPAPTPYADVNALLSELLGGARAILGPQFVGMLLYGSLASGDFDSASDVDVLVVTHDDLSPDTFTALTLAGPPTRAWIVGRASGCIG